MSLYCTYDFPVTQDLGSISLQHEGTKAMDCLSQLEVIEGLTAPMRTTKESKVVVLWTCKQWVKSLSIDAFRRTVIEFLKGLVSRIDTLGLGRQTHSNDIGISILK
jgi:hypothetical protein